MADNENTPGSVDMAQSGTDQLPQQHIRSDLPVDSSGVIPFVEEYPADYEEEVPEGIEQEHEEPVDDQPVEESVTEQETQEQRAEEVKPQPALSTQEDIDRLVEQRVNERLADVEYQQRMAQRQVNADAFVNQNQTVLELERERMELYKRYNEAQSFEDGESMTAIAKQYNSLGRTMEAHKELLKRQFDLQAQVSDNIVTKFKESNKLVSDIALASKLPIQTDSYGNADISKFSTQDKTKFQMLIAYCVQNGIVTQEPTIYGSEPMEVISKPDEFKRHWQLVFGGNTPTNPTKNGIAAGDTKPTVLQPSRSNGVVNGGISKQNLHNLAYNERAFAAASPAEQNETLKWAANREADFFRTNGSMYNYPSHIRSIIGEDHLYRRTS